MEKKFKLGIIGAGFMSTAILNSVLKSNLVDKSKVIVSDISEQSLSNAKKAGVNVTLNNLYLTDNSEYVLFAVKPQSLNDVLVAISNTCCTKFISIMAGVKKSKIKSSLKQVKVARCMPNTPCSLCEGAVGADISDFTDKNDIDFISKLLSNLGQVVFVPEEKLNAVTGVSGSSPAYFYLFLKGIIDAGVKNGLSYEDAKLLAVNTMIGSGKMVLFNKDKSLDDLITAVCSKGGTTIQAINTYNDGGLSALTDKAIDACIKKSFELENL